IEFLWQTAPVEILGNGSVAVLRCRKTDGSDFVFDVPCEMVIKATGQQKQAGFFQNIGLATDETGRVSVNENMQTSNPKIFAGGDCVNGGAEAVDASQMGKLAAQGIHLSLTSENVMFTGANLVYEMFELVLTIFVIPKTISPIAKEAGRSGI